MKKRINKRATRACIHDSIRKIVKCKRSQEVLGMSFSMIFSILLIIAFLAVAIYAVVYFISFKNCSTQSMFISDLKEDVNTVWNSASKSQDFSRNLPTGIQQICFIDFSKSITGDKTIYDDLKRYEGKDANLFFYPNKKAYCKKADYKIEHIDLGKITELKNPYCIENNGKPVLKLSKGIYDALVCINCGENSGMSGFCGSSTRASCFSDSDCKAGGCSGQVCEGKNESMVTTCEALECYNNERYGVECGCVYGKCKWG